MAEMKNICGKIPVELHEKVRAEIEEKETSTQIFIQQVIEEHFNRLEGKGEESMEKRTLAVQVTEELFQRVKWVVAKEGIKQKDFIIRIIEKAVEEVEAKWQGLEQPEETPEADRMEESTEETAEEEITGEEIEEMETAEEEPDDESFEASTELDEEETDPELPEDDLREETKKAVYEHLHHEAIATIIKELTAIRRLSKYLKETYPDIHSAEELNRELLEEYLTYLATEAEGVNNYRADLTNLRGLLETIGKLYGYPHLEILFLASDLPRQVQPKLKSYSDSELIRFNAALAELDEQMERLMVIHQMLGTRISDTLTLQTDCLYRQDGHPMIQIRQMKTTTFVKPISAELELLIEKAIEYSKKRYGDTVYIFVDEKNSKRPMQYNTVQNKVMDLIQKKDLRDDHGELFGFGTHMFRHVYGIRLTELHLDDWTIAKLLGHTSVKNVKFYRKMSLQIIADETREIRAEMSRMIRANLAGWGKEYEQI